MYRKTVYFFVLLCLLVPLVAEDIDEDILNKPFFSGKSVDIRRLLNKEHRKGYNFKDIQLLSEVISLYREGSVLSKKKQLEQLLQIYYVYKDVKKENPEAMYILGRLHFYGFIDRDLEQAKLWYGRAASLGHARAQKSYTASTQSSIFLSEST